MVILGVVIALVLVAVIGFAAFRIFGGGGRDNADNTVTEQEQEDEEEGSLIIRGRRRWFCRYGGGYFGGRDASRGRNS